MNSKMETNQQSTLSSKHVSIFRTLFFAIIALLLLYQLFTNDVKTLLNNVEGMSKLLGLSEETGRVRFLILIVLNALGAIGVLLALWGSLQAQSRTISNGVALATLGLLASGIYQILSANLQLIGSFRLPFTVIGLFYLLVAIIVWLIGNEKVRG